MGWFRKGEPPGYPPDLKQAQDILHAAVRYVMATEENYPERQVLDLYNTLREAVYRGNRR